MQGNNYQLDKEPLLNVPLFMPSIDTQLFFSNIVNQILKGKNQGLDTSALEHQIDVLVYHLYELSYEEACVIDKGLSRKDFEKYQIR
jgi:adenine-specific DNA-methyltransferase